MNDSAITQTLTRWRLVLGDVAQQHGICIAGGDDEAQRIDALVGFLFEGGTGGASGKPKDRSGGTGRGHAMNVPRWVDEVGQLFPARQRR